MPARCISLSHLDDFHFKHRQFSCARLAPERTFLQSFAKTASGGEMKRLTASSLHPELCEDRFRRRNEALECKLAASRNGRDLPPEHKVCMQGVRAGVCMQGVYATEFMQEFMQRFACRGLHAEVCMQRFACGTSHWHARRANS